MLFPFRIAWSHRLDEIRISNVRSSDRTLNVFALWNIEKFIEPFQFLCETFWMTIHKVNKVAEGDVYRNEKKYCSRQTLGHLVDWFDFHFNLFAIAIFTIFHLNQYLHNSGIRYTATPINRFMFTFQMKFTSVEFGVRLLISNFSTW